METDTDRKDYMKAMMKKANITNYEFFPAVRGSNYKKSVAPNAIPSKYRKEMNPGEIGHYISFSKILDDIIKNGYEHTLFFEDDLCISKDFKKQFNEYVKELPEDYDILSFSWAKNHTNIGQALNNNSNLLIPYQIGIYEMHNIFIGTESLLISLKGAKMIRRKMFKMLFQSDKYLDILKDIGYINLYALKTPITFQNVKFESHIQKYPNEKTDLITDECEI